MIGIVVLAFITFSAATTIHSTTTATAIHSSTTATTTHYSTKVSTIHSTTTATTIHASTTATTIHSSTTASTIYSTTTATFINTTPKYTSTGRTQSLLIKSHHKPKIGIIALGLFLTQDIFYHKYQPSGAGGSRSLPATPATPHYAPA